MPGISVEKLTASIVISRFMRRATSVKRSIWKPSTPPPSLGMACGAKVPSTPVRSGGSFSWASAGAAPSMAGELTTDEESRRMVWDTVNRFKGLDFVWNHVGHPGRAAVGGIDMSAFNLAVDLNLRTVLITTEAAIPELRARGGGSLLFTASTSGLVGSGFSPVYSMCKFGVVGFVTSLALRLAP